MAGRLEEGYREVFRTLLARVRPRRLEFGVELLMGRARERSRRDAIPLPSALADLYELTRGRVERRVALMAACTVAPPVATDAHEMPRFVCDASLGGLARWLWAAGYEARSVPSSPSVAALRQAQASGGLLLTSDTRILSRREVRRGTLRTLWIPSSLGAIEQLGRVLRELSLPLRASRCMSCGGGLAAVSKDAVRDRIPPRTAAWKDEYVLCSRCHRLFWRGTHWTRIRLQLEEASGRGGEG